MTWQLRGFVLFVIVMPGFGILSGCGSPPAESPKPNQTDRKPVVKQKPKQPFLNPFVPKDTRLDFTQLAHPLSVHNVAFSPDGKMAVTCGKDKTARRFEVTTGKMIGEPLLHEKEVRAVAFSPDGKILACGVHNSTFQLWEAKTGKKLGAPLKHPDGGVFEFAFSPDGTKLITRGGTSALLWDVEKRKPLDKPWGHKRSVLSIACSPDGKYVATASQDRSARLWDVATGQNVGLQMQHKDRVVQVAFSPDGKHVATASRDKTARLWQVPEGTPVGKVMQHKDRVVSLAFRPDGEAIATASGKEARLWKIPSCHPVTDPISHSKTVSVAAFSPNGKMLATGCADHKIRLWDSATGKQIGKVLRNRGGVRKMAFSSDSKHLLACCSYTIGGFLWQVP